MSGIAPYALLCRILAREQACTRGAAYRLIRERVGEVNAALRHGINVGREVAFSSPAAKSHGNPSVVLVHAALALPQL